MPDRRRLITGVLWTLFTCTIGLHPHGWQSAVAGTAPAADHARHDDRGQILVIGDSLSAEYGLPHGSGWVAIVAERLHNQGTGYQIHNSSISGDTTSGGLTRLPADLERVNPDIVLIELGANDALRGLSLDVARDNLAQMIRLAQESGADVILTGMQIPPNYGPQYAKRFADLFPELATTYQVTLVPFLLEGFATQADMFQEDGIHPNTSAQPIIADTVWEYLLPLMTAGKPQAGTN